MPVEMPESCSIVLAIPLMATRVVVDRVDAQIHPLVPEPDAGLVREPAGIGEEAPLVIRVLVEDVDGQPNHVVRIGPRWQEVHDLPELFDAGLVDELDLHRLGITSDDGDVERVEQ